MDKTIRIQAIYIDGSFAYMGTEARVDELLTEAKEASLPGFMQSGQIVDYCDFSSAVHIADMGTICYGSENPTPSFNEQFSEDGPSLVRELSERIA